MSASERLQGITLVQDERKHRLGVRHGFQTSALVVNESPTVFNHVIEMTLIDHDYVRWMAQ